MVHKFDQWMEKYVPVEDYKKILVKIPGTMKNDVPVLKDRCKEIIKAVNHFDCTLLLFDYHTWFNCSILKQVLEIAKIFTKEDPTNVLSSLQTYSEEVLHKYCKRNIFECPPPSGISRTEGITYCVLKLGHSDPLLGEKEYTTDEIRLVQAKIMALFELQNYAMKLCTVGMGCVELVYSMPLCIYAELFPLNEDQCRKLTTVGVSEIIVKDYHYKLDNVSGIHIKCALGRLLLLFHLVS